MPPCSESQKQNPDSAALAERYAAALREVGLDDAASLPVEELRAMAHARAGQVLRQFASLSQSPRAAEIPPELWALEPLFRAFYERTRPENFQKEKLD